MSDQTEGNDMAAEQPGTATAMTGIPAEASLEEKVDWLIEAYKTGSFPEHIASLNISRRMKCAFLTYETLGYVSEIGFPVMAKELRPAFKKLPMAKRRLINKHAFAPVWLSIFGPLYYVLSGMWKKGIVLFIAAIVIATVVRIVYAMATGTYFPPHLGTGLGVGIAISWIIMAPFDRYRVLMRKEDFWL